MRPFIAVTAVTAFYHCRSQSLPLLLLLMKSFTAVTPVATFYHSRSQSLPLLLLPMKSFTVVTSVTFTNKVVHSPLLLLFTTDVIHSRYFCYCSLPLSSTVVTPVTAFYDWCSLPVPLLLLFITDVHCCYPCNFFLPLMSFTAVTPVASFLTADVFIAVTPVTSFYRWYSLSLPFSLLFTTDSLCRYPSVLLLFTTNFVNSRYPCCLFLPLMLLTAVTPVTSFYHWC